MLEDKFMIYSSTIFLNPVTKKNSLQIFKNFKTGKRFVSQSEKYIEFEKNAGYFLKKIGRPISDPVEVCCIFYRKDNRKVDLTNLLEAIDDILVKYKILKDDNFSIIKSHDGSRVFVDKKNPRVEIYIYKFV